MSNLGSSLGTTQEYIPVVPSTQLGRFAGLAMHFPVLTDSAGDAAGSTSLLSAVQAERRNIALNGNGIWNAGQSFSVATEPLGVYRVWTIGVSASASNANLVVLRAGLSIALAADTNTVLATSGAPSSGTGANGDVAVDYAGNSYYIKVSGAWSVVSTIYTGGSGAALPTPLAFSTVVPMTGNVAMALHVMAGNVTLTQAASPVDGAQAKLVFQPDGTSTVTLPTGWLPFASGGQAYSQSNYDILFAQYEAATATTYYGWSLGPSYSVPVPPTLVSATVSDSAPTIIQLVFSEAIQSAMPAASAFAVSSGHTISSVTYVDSTHVNLICATSFAPGETKTLAYTAPGTNPIKDTAGDLLANITAATITDSVGYPTVTGAVVANGTPTVINLTLSENIQNVTMPATSAFAVSGHTVTAVTYVDATHVNVTVSAAFTNGETARTIGYALPGSNPIVDSGGTALQTFSGLSITNNVSPGATYLQFSTTELNGTLTGTAPQTISVTNGTISRFAGANLKFPAGVACSAVFTLTSQATSSGRLSLFFDATDNTTLALASAAGHGFLELEFGAGDTQYSQLSADESVYNGPTGTITVGDKYKLSKTAGATPTLAVAVSTDGGTTYTQIGATVTGTNIDYFLKAAIQAVSGTVSVELTSQTGMA